MMNNLEQDNFLLELENALIVEEAKMLDLDPEADDFGIKNKNQADYFIKLLNDVREEQKQIVTLCNDKIKRQTEIINAFKEQKLTGLNSQEQYYLALLKTYAENELKDSKKRSVKLPEGTLGFTKQQPRFEYDETLQSWLEENKPEFIKREEKKSVDKKLLKDSGAVVGDKLVVNGETIHGVTIIEQEDKFTVK